MCNFYSLCFRKNQYLPLIKKGVRLEVKDNIAYLDGVFMHKLLVEPKVCESNDVKLEELFSDYPEKKPWIAKEIDGNFYIYKGSIDPYLLSLGFQIEEGTCYMAIEGSKVTNVSIDNGRVITRLFKEDKQICIIEIRKDANIIIDDNVVTILEWDGVKFICR